MASGKSPKPPEPAPPIPVPTPDDPQLVDVQRKKRDEAAEREGAQASLLAPRGSVRGGGRAKKLGSF